MGKGRQRRRGQNNVKRGIVSPESSTPATSELQSYQQQGLSLQRKRLYLLLAFIAVSCGLYYLLPVIIQLIQSQGNNKAAPKVTLMPPILTLY